MTTIAGLTTDPNELKDDFSINMLIYGVPGVGKTYLAGSAGMVPEMSPVLYIDIEGGGLTIKKSFPDADIEFLRLDNPDKLKDVYEYLKTKEHGFKTVVIDSFSELHDMSIATITQEAAKANSSQDSEVPSPREYGKARTRSRSRIRGFRDMDINVIMTTHVQNDRDSIDGTMFFKPALAGKLAEEIPGFVDIVLYMYTKKQDKKALALDRKALTQPDGKHYAKDRTGKLPTIIEDMTMSSIYKTIRR